MKQRILFIILGVCLLLGLVNCSQGRATILTNTPTPVPLVFPKIDRHPAVEGYHRGILSKLGSYNPKSDDPFQVDLRSYDLSRLNLSSNAEQLRSASFDNQTIWPSANLMPKGFDWKQILERGKNPGLGIRGLHLQGVTGKGIGIAILDQPLQVEHPEYRDQLKLYEEINVDPSWTAAMHGPAVASLAVGKTIGVAPEADLYFIADWFVDHDQKVNFAFLAQGIHRVLEINRSLPDGQKIRVISISRGFDPQERGYSELMAAIQEADNQSIPVISVGMFGSKKMGTRGLGREFLTDPDKPASYKPAVFLEPYLDKIIGQTNQLYVPIDARTTAAPTGLDDYAFYGVGGMSWAEPYLAGVYALACQVNPKITPDQFWKKALSTGSYVEVSHNGQQARIGPIINPPSLIQAIQIEE